MPRLESRVAALKYQWGTALNICILISAVSYYNHVTFSPFFLHPVLEAPVFSAGTWLHCQLNEDSALPPTSPAPLAWAQAASEAWRTCYSFWACGMNTVKRQVDL